jgi:hypothetical protein
MRKHFSYLLKEKLWEKKFWSEGHFYRSVGAVNKETMKHYIEDCQDKHWGGASASIVYCMVLDILFLVNWFLTGNYLNIQTKSLNTRIYAKYIHKRITMTDIFDAKIMCKKCNLEMEKEDIHKEGVVVRAVVCPNCSDKIIHPQDLNSLQQFHDLRDKTFVVKLRMVGNSHAISIPKEIVDFMNEQQMRANHMRKKMDEMVRLCFEDFGTLRMKFGEEYEE